MLSYSGPGSTVDFRTYANAFALRLLLGIL